WTEIDRHIRIEPARLYCWPGTVAKSCRDSCFGLDSGRPQSYHIRCGAILDGGESCESNGAIQKPIRLEYVAENPLFLKSCCSVSALPTSAAQNKHPNR